MNALNSIHLEIQTRRHGFYNFHIHLCVHVRYVLRRIHTFARCATKNNAYSMNHPSLLHSCRLRGWLWIVVTSNLHLLYRVESPGLLPLQGNAHSPCSAFPSPTPTAVNPMISPVPHPLPTYPTAGDPKNWGPVAHPTPQPTPMPTPGDINME